MSFELGLSAKPGTVFDYVAYLLFRSTFHGFFLCPSAYWHAKNKKQESLAFTYMLVCSESLVILIVDRR